MDKGIFKCSEWKEGKIELKKLRFTIPIMILVAVVAMWMLKKDFSEIDLQMRIIISAGASVLSGIISFFLFGLDKGEKWINPTYA